MSTKLGELLEMLTYMRPVDSDTEDQFTKRFVASLPGASIDVHGNWHVMIGDSPILWSCHTDTVHDCAGRQTVHYNARTGIVQLSRKSRRYASCLGADDTAGVWLMRQMVLRGVPGHYIFHYGEEVGGRGSNDLADRSPELLEGSLFAIALDRKGTGDVIDRQFGRCCSNAFARSLAGELNRLGLHYSPAPGIYTDTANYTGIIGECTNLSVGYEGAHSPRETLNCRFLVTLLETLCVLNPDALVNEREPETYSYSGTWEGSQPPITTIDRSNHYYDRPRSEPFSLYCGRFAYEHCEWCGGSFSLDESSAVDFIHYCDADCEQQAIHDDAWDTTASQSTYLDPNYQDVIEALGREVDS